MWKNYFTREQVINLIKAHGVQSKPPKAGEVLRIVPPLNSGRGVTSIRPSKKKSTYGKALYQVICYPANHPTITKEI